MSILCEKSQQEKNKALQALIPGNDGLDKKDINCWTGLITVAFDGTTVTVKTLLDNGNNVNEQTQADCANSGAGCVESQSNILETLLGNDVGGKGKDLNDQKILIAALLNGHAEIVKLLKHYGAKA
jgi:ankyrin repeat protein